MICENLRRRFSTHCCCRGAERQHRLGLVNTTLGLESFRPLLVLNAGANHCLTSGMWSSRTSGTMALKSYSWTP